MKTLLVKTAIVISLLGTVVLSTSCSAESREIHSGNGIRYIDAEEFEIIRSAYENVDFSGEFVKGNTEEYDFYKEKFYRMVNLEVPFVDERANNSYFLDEFKEMNYSHESNTAYEGAWSDMFEASNYIYYFFDMDADGSPELCVTDEARFTYIFKYCADTDSIILWHEIPPSWLRLLGTKKLWWYSGGMPVKYSFYQLDNNGDAELSVSFYLEGFTNENGEADTRYMASLPEHTDADRNTELTRTLRSIGVVEPYSGLLYFRVTEEQWDILTNGFFSTRDASIDSIKEVRFTFEELFGE